MMDHSLKQNASTEIKLTQHILAAVLVGAIASVLGNLVILVAARDLLEINVLVPAFFYSTSLEILTYRHIVIVSFLLAFAAGATMCFLISKTSSPSIVFLSLALLIFFASWLLPLNLPITVTWSTKITLILMHLMTAIGITAPMLRARECALRSFLLAHSSSANHSLTQV